MEKLPTNPPGDRTQGAAPEPTAPSTPTVGPREVWATDEMRQACARRDVAEVYQRLNAAGVSQRRLAAATGQSQSEVSEIMRRRRVVGDVGVLQRIADGLGVPRGWWGLAHTLPTDDRCGRDAGAASDGA